MKTKSTIQQLVKFKKRTRIKWTVLSSVIGVSKFTLSRWINGKHEPLPVYEKIILDIIKKSVDS